MMEDCSSSQLEVRLSAEVGMEQQWSLGSEEGAARSNGD